MEKSLKVTVFGQGLNSFLGILRDCTLAYCFGASEDIALFFIAFRFFALFRHMVGESTIFSLFIPFYEEARLRGEGWSFLKNFSSKISLIIIFGVGIVELGLLVLAFFVSNSEVLIYTALLMPSILFVFLSVTQSALLQCESNFFWATFLPNIAHFFWIVGAFAIVQFVKSNRILLFCLVVVLAFAFQWLFANIVVQKKIKPTTSIKLSSLKDLKNPFLINMLSSFTLFFVPLIGSLFAKVIDDRAPAYLWYGFRIQQIAVIVWGLTLVMVNLPNISAAIKNLNFDRARKVFDCYFYLAFKWMGIISIIFILFHYKLTQLFYFRGNFDEVALVESSRCLLGFAPSLIAQVWVLLICNLFCGLKRYSIVLKSTLINICANICISFLFVYSFEIDAMSLAIAFSISSWLQFLYLKVSLDKNCAWLVKVKQKSIG